MFKRMSIRGISLILLSALLLTLAACGAAPTESAPPDSENSAESGAPQEDIEMPEDFVLISGGSFEMGSPEDEPWRSADERLHTVTVSDFYMSAYEVTQEEYSELMEDNPSTFSGDRLPVENITWYDAAVFCNARSEREGLTPA